MAELLHVDNRIATVSSAVKSVRSGEVVKLRVTGVLPGNRFRVLWGTRSLIAESTLPLKAGQLVQARVSKIGRALQLQLLTPSSSQSSPSPALATPSQALTAAFIKASMGLPPDVELEKMSVLLGRCRGRKNRLARLYVDFFSRGAHPSADFLEWVDMLFHGRRRQGRNPPGWERPPGASECAESFSEADEDEPALVSLLNQSPARGEHWCFRSHRRTLGGKELLLTWKVRQSGQPAMALTVRDGERELEFLLEGLNPVSMTVYRGEKTEIPEKNWEEFCRRLALKKIVVSNTIRDIELSDGFTAGSGEVG